MILVSGCLLLAWMTSIGKTLTFDSKRSSGTSETPWTNPSETLSFITNIFCRFLQQIHSKISFLVNKFTFNSHEQPADDNISSLAWMQWYCLNRLNHKNQLRQNLCLSVNFSQKGQTEPIFRWDIINYFISWATFK